jgi:hypothetical protein
MKLIKRVRLTLSVSLLTIALAVFGFATEVFAQTAQPTPAPSGSNPTYVAPTDVPVEWSLFWVLMFFLTLAVGLIFANWLVRRGTFDNEYDPTKP